jgi:hypothetical protein
MVSPGDFVLQFCRCLRRSLCDTASSALPVTLPQLDAFPEEPNMVRRSQSAREAADLKWPCDFCQTEGVWSTNSM